jgi:hypothetical protein
MSKLFVVLAFILVLLAVLVYAGLISGIPAGVFAWGGVDSFLLSLLV